jgi:hypothetical protein
MPRTSSALARHDELLAEGRDALLAGDKPRAQALLKAAVRLQPQSEEAWMWLSGTHADPAQMAECLERVLEINPGNQQAREGLQWIADHHGAPTVVVPPAATPTADPAPPPVQLRPRYTSHHSGSRLASAALHPFAVGACLGLLRLVGWLRPETLVLMRSDTAALSTLSAVGVALGTALLHGCALLFIWLVLAWLLSRVRAYGRADRFDSLLRAGEVWQPGYVWGAAFALGALGLGLSPGAWNTIVVVCWALLLLGVFLIERRLWRLLPDLGVSSQDRSRLAPRLYFALMLAALISLGLAGAVSAALLR